MAHATIGECIERARPLGKLLEAELVLGHVLNCARAQIFAHPERVLRSEEARRFDELWQRIQAGEPLAYVVGRKEFFGLDFVVDARVLVPRPETEHLVSTVVELVQGIEAPRILDVGTGCGAIAVALAHALPNARVFASDISGEALEVACANASRILSDRETGRGDVQFFRSDLLRDIPWTTLKLDVLVANLPYIGTEEFHFVEASVDRYEPSVALYGGSDGLQLYRQLFEQISCSNDARSVYPRWILGEFGSFQRERLEVIVWEKFSQASVEFYRDLAGLDRFFVIDRGPRNEHESQ